MKHQRLITSLIFPAVIILTLYLACSEAEAYVEYRDSAGSTGATCTGWWQYDLDPMDNDFVWINVPDPTWGWSDAIDEALCNSQYINNIDVETNYLPDSMYIDSDHGRRRYLFIRPAGGWSGNIHLDLCLGATVSLVTRGLEMHDHRDVNNPWCDETPNVNPADYYYTACQIEASLDTNGSLCGNEGIIQAFTAYAGQHHDNCRDAAICLAGLLRSKGIPTSIDVTYQVDTYAYFSGINLNIYGGMHAQCSAWNWTSGTWERCDPSYAANFVHPADLIIGRCMDPDYLTPGYSYPMGGTQPVLTVHYMWGEYGDPGASTECYQLRTDYTTEVYFTLAASCFSSFKCGKHDTAQVPGVNPLTHVADGTSALTHILDTEDVSIRCTIPSVVSGMLSFEGPVSSVMDIYSISGRHVMSTTPGTHSDISSGVYVYQVMHQNRILRRGRITVVR